MVQIQKTRVGRIGHRSVEGSVRFSQVNLRLRHFDTARIDGIAEGDNVEDSIMIQIRHRHRAEMLQDVLRGAECAVTVAQELVQVIPRLGKHVGSEPNEYVRLAVLISVAYKHRKRVNRGVSASETRYERLAKSSIAITKIHAELLGRAGGAGKPGN